MQRQSFDDHRYVQQVTEEIGKADYEKLCRELEESITAIKEGIEKQDLSSAAEAWFELSDFEKENLWRAPSKGGCFTTIERNTIKSQEFRESYYGTS